jgi:outer membrane protein
MIDRTYVYTALTELRSSVSRFVCVAVMAVAIGSTTATAQLNQEISFDQAVAIAMENSVVIKRGENNVLSQEASVRSAQANFLPNLNANSGASRRMGLGFDQTTFERTSTATNGFSVGINSSLNLFNGFRDVATLEQAEKSLEALQYGFQRTEQTVVFNVITNFLIVIRAQEDIKIRLDDVEAQQQLLDQIQEFVNAGSRPISDLYTQQATMANSESQLLAAENSLSNAQTRLVQVLQLDPLADYSFVSPDPESVSLAVTPYNETNLITSAFENRADLRAQEASIAALAQGIRIAKGGYYPSLNFSAGASSNWSSAAKTKVGEFPDGTPIFDTTPFNDQISDNRSGSFSLSMQIPLFNRLNVKTGVQRQRIVYDNAVLNLVDLRQSVALDVRQAYNNYQTAVKTLDVTEAGLRSAEQALQVEQERYNVGASTLVDLTVSQSRYTQASSQRIQGLFDFYFQQRLIEYYQGTLYPVGELFE